MLESKKTVLFNKNSISKKIDQFENKYEELIKTNISYTLPKKYNWDFISNQYLEVFDNITSYQNK